MLKVPVGQLQIGGFSLLPAQMIQTLSVSHSWQMLVSQRTNCLWIFTGYCLEYFHEF